MKAKAIHISQQTASNTAIIAKSMAVGALSFLLSAASLFGSISPFGIAFLCALPINYALTGIVGAVIGSIIFTSSPYTFYYIVTLCTIFVIKLALAKALKVKLKIPILCIMCASITITIAYIFTSIVTSSFFNFPKMFLESILAGCLTYFYAICSNALFKKKTTGIYSYIEISSIVILFITSITAMCNIHISTVNLGVVFGVLSIYIVMSHFGITGASVCAIVVAIALNLYSPSMLEFSGLLVISAFIAGVFSPLKKLAQISSFIGVSTFGLFLLGAPILLTYRLIDIFIATAIFVILPQRLFSFLSTKTKQNGEGPVSNLFQTSVKTKLNFASDTIKDLQKDLIAVSKRFSEIDCNNISSVYETAANKVCKGCSMQLGCWDNNYSETISAFQPVNEVLKTYGKIDIEQMPTYFKDNCCKLDKLTKGINDCYQVFSIKQGTKRHIEESRGLVVEQFNSIANMLLEVSDELGDISGYDYDASRKVLKIYSKIEYEPSQVICAIDKFGRMCVEIYSEHSIKTSARAICQAVCEVTQKDFDLPSISKIGGKTKIALFEKATYTVDFSVQQYSSNNNNVCGDSYEYFLDSKGYAYLILSDGMGQGKRAAIDSVMTCSILLKLIKAGFGLESAIKLINSSLLVKSSDESTATIDIARIDLYTGKTEFLKAGAAASYLYTKGNGLKIESSSLPVGILQGIEFDKKLAILRSGDVVVLVSDGVNENDDSWILGEIKRCSHLTAREISAKLLYETKHRRLDGHSDDITILVAKLNQGV